MSIKIVTEKTNPYKNFPYIKQELVTDHEGRQYTAYYYRKDYSPWERSTKIFKILSLIVKEGLSSHTKRQWSKVWQGKIEKQVRILNDISLNVVQNHPLLQEHATPVQPVIDSRGGTENPVIPISQKQQNANQTGSKVSSEATKQKLGLPIAIIDPVKTSETSQPPLITKVTTKNQKDPYEKAIISPQEKEKPDEADSKIYSEDNQKVELTLAVNPNKEEKASWVSLTTKVIDENQNHHSVWIRDVKRTFGDYSVYEIVLADGQMLGEVHLKVNQDNENKNFICINHIYIFRNYQTAGWEKIETALLEYAIQRSFAEKLEGRVKLKVIDKSDGFLFKNGFRYENQFICVLGTMYRNDINLINKYLNNPTPELEEEIKQSKAYKELLTNWEETAEKQLGQKPSNFQELIRHGCYLDKNAELYRAYYETDGTKKANVKETFDYGGWMSLCEEMRLKWKEQLQL